MSKEVTTSDAADVKPAVVESSITPEQFIARRSNRGRKPESKEPAKEPEKKAEEAVEPAPKEPESKEADEKQSKAPEEKKEPEAKDVHSKEVDLENLSEAELKELAEKLGSRAVARFGELTAKRKAAEEQLAALRAELMARQSQPADPLSDGKPKDNPYKSIKTLPELQAKAREVDEVIEWADDVLWSSDHLGSDDVVATVDGKELTKAQVRRALRDAQKARKEHLPARFQDLQAAEQRKAVKAQFEQAARKELDWLGGEDNDVRKQFEALKQSPILVKARESVPEIEPFIDYMVAHAANSIYGRKSIPLTTKASPSINPPSNPQSSVAKPEKQDSADSKRETEARKRLSETNAISDFVALRTAQISKRKSI